MDVNVIKQGAIFFIDDLNSEESVVYKGETTPKKRRPWVVVSNDKNNCFSQNITMCPLYTRTTTSLPTQVYIKRGVRDSVICCEQVTAIPKHMIDTRAYVGMLTDDNMNKVKKALKIYFGCDDSNETIDIKKIITNVLTSPNIESIIASKLVEMMLTGLTNNTINTTNEIINNNEVVADNDIVKDLNSNNFVTNNEECEVEEHTNSNNDNNITNSEVTPKTSNKPNKSGIKRPRKHPKGKTMSLQDCILFMKDVNDNMSNYDLVEKWKMFGLIHDKSVIAKKKYAIRFRLQKEGLL